MPEFDNLYMDINGLIHDCSNLNDEDLEMTEDKMFDAIFHDIEVIFKRENLHMYRPTVPSPMLIMNWFIKDKFLLFKFFNEK